MSMPRPSRPKTLDDILAEPPDVDRARLDAVTEADIARWEREDAGTGAPFDWTGATPVHRPAPPDC